MTSLRVERIIHFAFFHFVSRKLCFIARPMAIRPSNQYLSAIAALTLLSFIGRPALGETFNLIDGTKVEGKITAETALEYTVDVKVSASITDERKIAKKDVLTVIKQAGDEEAWKPLQAMKPGANSLAVGAYEAPLAALQKFLTDHPQSKHAADARAAFTAWETEKKRVLEGERKLDDKWLTAEDIAKDQYQINAKLAANYMKEQAARGDLVGAMNSFEAIKSNFPGSRAYIEGAETAKRILPNLLAELDRRGRAWAKEKTDRPARLAASSPQQKREIEDAIRREELNAKASLDAAKAQKLKWLPLLARNDESLTSLAKEAQEETKRLTGQDLDKLRKSVELAGNARTALDAKDVEGANKLISEASSLWQANEMLKSLRTDMAEMRTTMAAAAQATPEPTPVPATPEPAKMVRKATTGGAVEPAKMDGAQQAATDTEERPFLMTPLGAGVVVGGIILLLVLVQAIRKVVARRQDAEGGGAGHQE